MPSHPRRIRLSRAKGWRMPEGALNVARPGPFGNPFVIGPTLERAEAIQLYARMLAGEFASAPGLPDAQAQADARARILSRLGELRGHDLACWCSLDGPCHADILLDLANRDSAGD